jgi:uncharacterized protein with GYD domain
MTARTATTRYGSLLEIDQADAQHVQELAAIRGELAERGIEIEDSDAVLGNVDFLGVSDAPDHDAAFQSGTIFERRGFDAQRLHVMPTAEFAPDRGPLNGRACAAGLT